MLCSRDGFRQVQGLQLVLIPQESPPAVSIKGQSLDFFFSFIVEHKKQRAKSIVSSSDYIIYSLATKEPIDESAGWRLLGDHRRLKTPQGSEATEEAEIKPPAKRPSRAEINTVSKLLSKEKHLCHDSASMSRSPLIDFASS